MLTKKWWEFSNIYIINIFVSNNFIGVGELLSTDKSYRVDFLIYVQHIYLLIINLLVFDN